ncbi:hypothetical protein N8I74_14470 [Chitiniphilus purpureus]|uniref:Uncharacterized protein n=1 Tax=Chitiniphilus purpureus TaxID=2981137 RepID=A0ABY6DLD1_9NEIS|nr:hypothetical protein [Chitiniphilus sp. CD1]UXY14513.1 hypothetical protein N8I74_14470 [Chitiniphilus sp. CD1]
MSKVMAAHIQRYQDWLADPVTQARLRAGRRLDPDAATPVTTAAPAVSRPPAAPALEVNLSSAAYLKQQQEWLAQQSAPATGRFTIESMDSGTVFQPLLLDVAWDDTVPQQQAAYLSEAVAQATTLPQQAQSTGEERMAFTALASAKLAYLTTQWVPEHYRARFAAAAEDYMRLEQGAYQEIALSLTRASAQLQRQHGDPASPRTRALDAEVAALEQGQGRGQQLVSALRHALAPLGTASSDAGREAVWTQVRTVLDTPPDPSAWPDPAGPLAAYRQQALDGAAARQRAENERLVGSLRADWASFVAGLRRAPA